MIRQSTRSKNFSRKKSAYRLRLGQHSKSCWSWCNYSAALYLRLLNSHLIGFLALAKERVRLLP
ncbi:MAG: hypothetical protein KZQ66_00815, partial [Candidatus Thiodiazotropha sp. (ex Lucinoma aequizonata)]|nr:hypothetical protein [Candidatus Thiodiazotropha sp. (ex Lucinoma aequizonata)]